MVQHSVSPRLFQVTRLFWCVIAAIMAVDAIGLYLLGITIDIAFFYEFLWLIVLCLGIIFTHGRLHHDDNLCIFAHALLQLTFAGASLGVLDYLVAALNFPLIDKTLITMDAWLGFDWRSYIAWLDHQRPRFAEILAFGYISFKYQVLLIVFLLFIGKHPAHAQRFLIAYLMTALVTIILAALFPAVGGYVYYDIDVKSFAHLHPAAARIHETALLAMRNHSLHTITFPQEGLVTFPSFHSTAVFLFLYGSLPLRPLFLLLVPVNIAMLLSTPADGGHYLVDVLAGAAIAFIGIYAIERVIPRTA